MKLDQDEQRLAQFCWQYFGRRPRYRAKAQSDCGCRFWRSNDSLVPLFNAAAWVVGAALSGVIGNYAHEALRRKIRATDKLSRRAVIRIATMAVAEKRFELGYGRVSPYEFEVAFCGKAFGDWGVEVEVGEDTYFVWIPQDDIRDLRVMVAWREDET